MFQFIEGDLKQKQINAYAREEETHREHEPNLEPVEQYPPKDGLMREAAQAFLSKRKKAIEQLRSRDRGMAKHYSLRVKNLKRNHVEDREYLSFANSLAVSPKRSL